MGCRLTHKFMSVSPACHPQKDAYAQGVVIYLIAIAFFTLLDATTKFLLPHYSLLVLLWARYFFHVLFCLFFLSRSDWIKLVRPNEPKIQLYRSLLIIGASLCFFAALRTMPLAEMVSISFTSPLFLALLSVPMLGERIGRRRLAACLIGLISVCIILRPGRGLMTWNSLYPLGAAFFYTLYMIFTKKLQNKETPLLTLLYPVFFALVMATLAAPFYWENPDLTGWMLMPLLGLFGALGHLALIQALSCTTASSIAPYQYFQIIYATALGYILFRDFPDFYTFLGSFIIVGSGLYLFYRERKVKGSLP